MKRALWGFVLMAVVAALTGCVQDQMCCPGAAPGPCAAVAGNGIYDGLGYDPYSPAVRASRMAAQEVISPGPPTGAITYPYYTTRGPRDFLAQDLRPLGP